MQLAIPASHKASDPSFLPSSFAFRGAPGASNPRQGGRTNLTMSALLWSSHSFAPHRLPAHIRCLIALRHLLPLQQLARELLQKAPNQILLEEEVKHLCTMKLFSSDQVRQAGAPGAQGTRGGFSRIAAALPG